MCGSSFQAYQSTKSCLDVQGNVAILGMMVTTSTSAAFLVGTEMSLTITNCGPAAANDAISVLRTGSNCVDEPLLYPLPAATFS